MPSPINSNGKWKSTCYSFLALTLIACAPTVHGQTDTPEGLKANFSGANAKMMRKTPAGPQKGEIAKTKWEFSPEGKLNGQILGLKTRIYDTGIWTVEGNKLCTQWQNWERGKKHCYLITVQGDSFTIGGETITFMLASGPDGLFRGKFTHTK